jgi:hypothetical protein
MRRFNEFKTDKKYFEDFDNSNSHRIVSVPIVSVPTQDPDLTPKASTINIPIIDPDLIAIASVVNTPISSTVARLEIPVAEATINNLFSSNSLIGTVYGDHTRNPFWDTKEDIGIQAIPVIVIDKGVGDNSISSMDKGTQAGPTTPILGDSTPPVSHTTSYGKPLGLFPDWTTFSKKDQGVQTSTPDGYSLPSASDVIARSAAISPCICKYNYRIPKSFYSGIRSI